MTYADPASDLPTVLRALGATLTVAGSHGERSVGIDGFFQGVMSTTLAADDLLTAVRIPVAEGQRGTAYVKFPHPASRYAVVGAAVALTAGAGGGWRAVLTPGANRETICVDVSVAIGGLVPAPVRCAAVEQALAGKPLSDDVFAAAAGAVAGDLGDDLLGDVFASAEYRKAVAPVWVRRALQAAAGRAG